MSEVARAVAPPDENLEGIPAVLALQDVGADASSGDAPSVRAINFHHTPAHLRARYAAQLDGLGERYGPVDEAGLDALLDGRALPHGRPGLLPVLYEGYRDGYEVALEVIEREGLVAWLFVPSAFPDVPAGEQHAWALAHELDLAGGDPARIAMTWDELRDVAARGHVIACHTATHSSLAALTTEADVQRELVASKARLEAATGVEVRTVAWLWGAPVGLDPAFDDRLAGLGYRFVFSNDKIQRLGR